MVRREKARQKPASAANPVSQGKGRKSRTRGPAITGFAGPAEYATGTGRLHARLAARRSNARVELHATVQFLKDDWRDVDPAL